MIVCPRCSHENEDSAMNCASCRINLQWASENPHEAALDGLQREEGLERAAKPVEHAARVENRPIRGFFVIGLLLGVLAAMVEGIWLLLETMFRSWPSPAVQAGLALVVVGGSIAVTVLLRGEPKPNLVGALRLWARIALIACLLVGLGFCLLRLALVLIAERTGQSLIAQYTLGERGFSGADLRGADVYDAKLSGADLSDANLSGADLRGSNLRGANLSGADLRGANLDEADLGGANLRGADLSTIHLRRANLSGADLSQANLTGANLSGANLRGAHLSTIHLRRANLSGADLREANLRGAHLTETNLSGADLREANLSAADLRGADLTGVQIQWADLSGADLRDARLTGAKLYRIILRGADLRGATVTDEQLAQAGNLKGAILPDGSVHE